jgi:NAD+ synthase (glutamine-hydrolysing)
MHRYDNPELSTEALAEHIRARFVCAYMATVNSSQATRDAARAIAADCGAEFLDGEIDDIVSSVEGIGQAMLGRTLSWEVPSEDLALQNVQARARSVLIWLIANIRGFVLLATSNKSEAAVGYTTMDGDTSGGLSPIADIPKSLIQIWLAWARRKHSMAAIDLVLAKPASAELRPKEQEQTDEDDLMPFEVLDQLMDHFVQRALEPRDIFEVLWPVFEERYGGERVAFADHIAKFVRMLCRAQWKRECFAISFRVMPFDLDLKGGFCFSPV